MSGSRAAVLHDLIEQPNFNPATQNNRGDWSLRDVSTGAVFRAADGKPACVDHGPMNAVVADRSLWRCLMCGRAAYVSVWLPEPPSTTDPNPDPVTPQRANESAKKGNEE